MLTNDQIRIHIDETGNAAFPKRMMITHLQSNMTVTGTGRDEVKLQADLINALEVQVKTAGIEVKDRQQEQIDDHQAENVALRETLAKQQAQIDKLLAMVTEPEAAKRPYVRKAKAE